MRHCQKLGQGRSPQDNQWQALISEIEAIALDKVGVLPFMWLSVTEGDQGGRLARLSHWNKTEMIEGQGEVPLVAKETVWRDYYTGARADVLSGKPYLDETAFGEQHNCMFAVFYRPRETVASFIVEWMESPCNRAR